MPEIKPDLSEWSRCISVHWSLPVQCVLPCTHRQNWHEAWHPESGNRVRYRRAYGTFRTEELIGDGWSDLGIPPPVSERDELLAKLTEAEADRDRAREIAVALEQENAQLQAKLDQPCGSCHPCTNYRDETWRAADRKPPHVHEWDELRAAEKRVREVCSEPTPHPSHDHLCPDDILRALDGGEAL